MIDDDIRDALNVEPSREFQARVRTRIASEPAPSVWRWSWALVAAVAIAGAIAFGIVVSRPDRAPTDLVRALSPAGEPVGQDQGTRPGATTESAVNSDRSARHEAASTRRQAGAFSRQTGAPADLDASRAGATETLLDPAETRALQQLIAGVRDGRVDLSAAQKSTSPAPIELEPVVDIVISPITIEPIAPIDGAEGVRP